jgi:hypothetical protein
MRLLLTGTSENVACADIHIQNSILVTLVS